MRPIIVKVKSIQRDVNGEDTKFELISTGKYYEKNGAKYIRYNETEATGMEGVQTTIKVMPRSIILVRNGIAHMRHEYELGKMTESYYETPYGQLQLGVKTHELTTNITDGEGAVHLGYDIAIGGEWQYYNQLIIEVREDN